MGLIDARIEEPRAFLDENTSLDRTSLTRAIRESPATQVPGFAKTSSTTCCGYIPAAIQLHAVTSVTAHATPASPRPNSATVFIQVLISACNPPNACGTVSE